MKIHYKVMTNRFDFRLEMVRSAQRYGVSETARLFDVSRPTVYKWKGRFELDSSLTVSSAFSGIGGQLHRREKV